MRAVFFFSSRRRHTRLQGDWSSDVCSSDLQRLGGSAGTLSPRCGRHGEKGDTRQKKPPSRSGNSGGGVSIRRSEERRVGKEWRGTGRPAHIRSKDGASTKDEAGTEARSMEC